MKPSRTCLVPNFEKKNFLTKELTTGSYLCCPSALLLRPDCLEIKWRILHSVWCWRFWFAWLLPHSFNRLDSLFCHLRPCWMTIHARQPTSHTLRVPTEANRHNGPAILGTNVDQKRANELCRTCKSRLVSSG